MARLAGCMLKQDVSHLKVGWENVSWWARKAAVNLSCSCHPLFPLVCFHAYLCTRMRFETDDGRHKACLQAFQHWAMHDRRAYLVQPHNADIHEERWQESLHQC